MKNLTEMALNMIKNGLAKLKMERRCHSNRPIMFGDLILISSKECEIKIYKIEKEKTKKEL